MARLRIIYNKGDPVAEYRNGELVWAAEPPEEKSAGYYIMPDTAPYQSMVDGSMIEGRKQHREHLRRHSLMEVGNETKYLKPYGQYKSPPGLKETLIRETYKARDAGKLYRK